MKTIRLLTIGNSFADNALTYLEPIADSTDRFTMRIGRANLGGCSLEKHWNLCEYTARNPHHKTYRFGLSPDGQPREGSLSMALAAEPWDVVTLQQVSHLSWRHASYQPYLGALHAFVRQHAPQAAICLHQTWAYRSDSPFLVQNSLTQELMFERICAAYAHYAAELGCGVLPSGLAIQQARRAPGRTFTWPEKDFDYQEPTAAPALPRQEHSLAVGWRWAINDSPTGIPDLRLDANHLNLHGCYLVGCLWFECLTGCDAREITFRPEVITTDDAAFLRATAHATARLAAGQK